MKSRSILSRTATIAILCLLGSVAPLLADEPARHTFAIGMNDFLLDGRRLQIRCGEIHAARVPREYWRHRLQMARAMGLNTVCAYLFWNQIEPRPGEFNWSGQAGVAEFCRIAQSEGLWVILRPGPYSCAEWEMGGLPWWLLKNDDIQLRTRDPRFLDAATFGLWSGADRPLSHEGWTIAYVDSEERDQEDGTAENAIDGQTANYWHTEWSAAQPNHPHQLVLDLGKLQTISGFRYVPRQGTGGGRIKDCRIYVGDDLIRR